MKEGSFVHDSISLHNKDMPTTQKNTFDAQYKRLNAAQKEAVDSIEGPVMVVAGPGTGKTQILTLRIANILTKTDADPENILALTFTESGVVSMRRRLTQFIGGAAYAVNINTFHGFCNHIIQSYPEEFPHIIGSQHITEAEQIGILETLITETSLDLLRPFGAPMHYLKDVRSAIDDLKREDVSPKRFKEILKEEWEAFENIEDLHHEKGAHKGKKKSQYRDLEKKLKKNDELAALYAAYQKTLRKERVYDYSDMIMEVVAALEKNEDLLLSLQEQYQYILVDEHQDTNNAQNRIIEMLSNFHEQPNVFVVGDEKQAIFRFQGASLENFLYFKTLYPAARLIVLEENYRSTQAILDVAHDLLPAEKKLQSQGHHTNESIEVRAFREPETELYFVAQHVKERIEQGTPAAEIAVLYRNNSDVIPLARMLEKMNIPFIIRSKQNVLEDISIQKLLTILHTLNDLGDDEQLATMLHIDFLSITPHDAYQLIALANKKKKPLLSVLRSENIRADIEFDDEESIRSLYHHINAWKRSSENESFGDFIERIIRESGYLTHIMSSPDRLDHLARLNGLFDEIKTQLENHTRFSLSDLLDYITILNTHNVSVRKSGASHLNRSAVQLMTAHGSKGLEFDYVYIINAFDGHWGNKRKRELLPLPERIYSLTGDSIAAKDANDDERRLFYVALTRARKHVCITYAEHNSDGKEQLPSQFIHEIDPSLLENADTEPAQKAWEESGLKFAERATKKAPERDLELIRHLFAERGFSVTALNNYLTCPWRYFYTNLFRIPKLPSKHQMYGTAVHDALKDLFDKRSKGESVSASTLLAAFEHYLEKHPLSEIEYEEALAKGREALTQYYQEYEEKWITRTVTEYAISDIMLADDIRLTGKIDKIELLNEEQIPEVNVVDYKTGKPKSRNFIEGKTKSSDGNIKRQLVFYRLLLDRQEPKKYTMVSGEIDFVEPNKSGNFQKERFLIEYTEVEALEEQVRAVAEQILSGSFWDARCDDGECEYCKLRELM